MEPSKLGPAGGARTWGWASLALGSLVLVIGLYLHFIRPETAPELPAQAVLVLDPLPWAYVRGIVAVETGAAVATECAATPCRLMLPPGEYRLQLEHPTYGSRAATVRLTAGQRTEFREPVSEQYDPERFDGEGS